jgi:hypothetical protein
MIYFVPEAPAAYAAEGITDPGMGYFASRSAALGPVPAETVIACFFKTLLDAGLLPLGRKRPLSS